MRSQPILYHFPLSTTSQKVRLCLAYKGIVLEERIVDLIKLEQLAPDYLALNPNGQVPTLVIEGQAIYESSIINELLEELYPSPSLLPAQDRPIARAQVRMWTKYIDVVPTVKIASPTYRAWVVPAVSQHPREQLLAQVATAPEETTRARWLRTVRGEISDEEVLSAYRAVEQMLSRMESMLSDRPWLVGDAITLADLETIPILVRLQHLGRADLISGKPRVSAWFQRVQALPAFTAVYSQLRALDT